jgi:hypothetical protein
MDNKLPTKNELEIIEKDFIEALDEYKKSEVKEEK